MYIKSLIWVSSLLFLYGCGGMVNLQDQSQAKEIAEQNYRFASVNVRLSEKAVIDKSTSQYFIKDKFVASLEKKLQKHGLLQADAASYLDVLVNKIHIRSQFKAFLFVPGKDSLQADVIVRGKNGIELHKFSVNSNYVLGGTTSTLASVRTAFLYSNFAKMVVDLFSGKNAESEDEHEE